MQGRALLVSGLCVCVSVAKTWSQTADEAFQSTFADEAQKVAKTPTKADDVAFGAKLLAAAEKSIDRPELQVLLCKKACQFAMNGPTGFPTAQKSMTLWTKLQPEQQQAARKRMLELCQSLYDNCRGPDKRVAGSCLIEVLLAKGDALLGAGQTVEALGVYKEAAGLARATRCPWGFCVDEKIAAARDCQNVEQTLERLEKALENSPTDKVIARQLAMLHLTGKDDTNTALRLWRRHGLDEKFMADLELACREASGLGLEERRRLRDFYGGLAPKAGPFGAVRMLQRSKGYAQEVVAAHSGDYTRLVQCERALDQLNAKLARACAAVNGGWLDLLHIIRPEKDAVWCGKDWRITEAGLVSPCVWFDWLMVPYLPPAEYDLCVSFTRHNGTQTILFVCTHGGRQFGFILSEAENTIGGLERINGARVTAQRRATRRIVLQNGRRYTVLIQVRRQGIGVSLDGQRIIQHRTDGSDMMLRETWKDKQPLALGLASHKNEMVFHLLRAKETRGQGTFVDHPKPQEKD